MEKEYKTNFRKKIFQFTLLPTVQFIHHREPVMINIFFHVHSCAQTESVTYLMMCFYSVNEYWMYSCIHTVYTRYFAHNRVCLYIFNLHSLSWQPGWFPSGLHIIGQWRTENDQRWRNTEEKDNLHKILGAKMQQCNLFSITIVSKKDKI